MHNYEYSIRIHVIEITINSGNDLYNKTVAITVINKYRKQIKIILYIAMTSFIKKIKFNYIIFNLINFQYINLSIIIIIAVY